MFPINIYDRDEPSASSAFFCERERARQRTIKGADEEMAEDYI